MPRKPKGVLPGLSMSGSECFAYSEDIFGNPHCRALTDIYCLKELRPCPFRATPEDAAAATTRSRRIVEAKRRTAKKSL